MKSFSRILTLSMGAAFTFAFALAVAPRASAAAKSNSQLLCFSGTQDTADGNTGGATNTGTCELRPNGVYVNTVDGDQDPNNGYGGAYYEQTSLSGKLLSEVNKLSFTYEGTGAAGGSPRFSIPIDEDSDGAWDGFAFVAWNDCSGNTTTAGTVDVVNDTTCAVWYDTRYTNWAEFAAAHPDYRIATDTIPFAVVDQPGEFTLSNVVIGTQPVNGLTKGSCQNGGWKTAETEAGKGFKNQGQCIAYVQSSPNSKHHRPEVVDGLRG